ncbi:MAG: 3-phosphoshikimate 1-carboxyvinyltransferase [Bacteroidaceae bacterium]
MQLLLKSPSSFKEIIRLPTSKSISNRVLVINALAQSTSLPACLSTCDDTRVMLEALMSDKRMVDIGAAGTAMRFLTAYYAVTPGEHVLTGTERMRHRPIRVLVDALRSIGADIHYVDQEGYPPLRIQGKPLVGSTIQLAGDVSSQYISALLLIAPMLPNGLTVCLEGEIISKPYIDLTLSLMRDFGAQVSWKSASAIQVLAQPYRPVSYTVESDWSAASYWYEMVALSGIGEVELKGLFKESYQGDQAVSTLFESLGVATHFTSDGVVLKKTTVRCSAMHYNFIDQPDLAQTFVVCCALLQIPFRFTGLRSLKIKETDRIVALITEMRKMGYSLLEEDGGVLSWSGKRTAAENAIVFDTYEDHRMAMALAPASFCVDGIRINNPEVVSKSYPTYWDDLKKIGFHITKEL